ncbi:MAG: hypothetical protein AAF560_09200 [Acidobacteriota bacterium]
MERCASGQASWRGDAFISDGSSASWTPPGSDMVICEPASVYEVENEPEAAWPWPDELTFGELSIRIPDPAGKTRCGRCRVRFSATGPTGFSEDQPICDMCLLEGSPELGMVMAVIAVVRAFGSAQPLSREEYQEALAELGAFSRIYERFASKSGPPRAFRIAGFE